MHCGKQPDVQLCVQADAGTGSSHHLAALPARLNTALGVGADSSVFGGLFITWVRT